jgi:hypothetical protein
MKSPINRTSAKEIIRLVDFCYKRGVVDAASVEDNLAVQDWVDSVYKQGRYGLVDFPDDECDWKRWRFYLLRWCRENRLSSLGFSYIDGIRKPAGFEYMIIPMTMRFYLQGVMEWLEYPNETALALFKSRYKQRWTNKVPQSMKNMRTDDFISMIQEYIYEFRQYPMPEMANLPESSMDNFEYAIWEMTRPTNAKIR